MTENEAIDIFQHVSLRITNYLTAGGLFNPELANHDQVCQLLRDCREGNDLAIAAMREREQLQKYAEFGKFFMEVIEKFSDDTLPDDKTDRFIEVWQRERKKVEQLQREVERYMDVIGSALGRPYQNGKDHPGLYASECAAIAESLLSEVEQSRAAVEASEKLVTKCRQILDEWNTNLRENWDMIFDRHVKKFFDLTNTARSAVQAANTIQGE